MTPSYIIIHHSISPSSQTRAKAEKSFNARHEKERYARSTLGWFIGYQYCIYGNGEVRQYRKDTEEGAHTWQAGMNRKSIGICLSGDFDKELPTAAQINALKALMKRLVKTYGIKDIYPHRKFATYKSCPGKRLPDNWAKELLKTKGDIMDVYYVKQGQKVGLAFDTEFTTTIVWAVDEELGHMLTTKYKPKDRTVTMSE